MKLVEKLSFCDNFKDFLNLSMHKTVNCLRNADFHCVHGTHRSEFLVCTERKIVRTYAVRIVIYIAVLSYAAQLFTKSALICWFPVFQ